MVKEKHNFIRIPMIADLSKKGVNFFENLGNLFDNKNAII
jgi:hypothetical protein